MLSPYLVATVGGKAQVVTFALDIVMRQGTPNIGPHQAPVVATDRLRRALTLRQRAFQKCPYYLQVVPLRDRDGRPLVATPQRAAHRRKRDVLRCIAGGDSPQEAASFLVLSRPPSAAPSQPRGSPHLAHPSPVEVKR